MSINLTQKERMLLQDQKSHEEICIQKYNNYANQAQDPQLKQLFNSIKTQEQQHYNTIEQTLNGQVPNMSQQQSQQSSVQGQTQQNQQAMDGAMNSESDAALCSDMLMTEKYISGAYNTAIFESTNANIRQALNHIQKEEQEHGEKIFNYMQSKGMYNPQ